MINIYYKYLSIITNTYVFFDKNNKYTYEVEYYKQKIKYN